MFMSEVFRVSPTLHSLEIWCSQTTCKREFSFFTAEGEVLKTSFTPEMLEQVNFSDVPCTKIEKHQVSGEVRVLAQLGRGGREQKSDILGEGSFLRLRTGRLQYISVRLACILHIGALQCIGE